MIEYLHVDNWSIQMLDFILKLHLTSAIYNDSQTPVSNRQASVISIFQII